MYGTCIYIHVDEHSNSNMIIDSNDSPVYKDILKLILIRM